MGSFAYIQYLPYVVFALVHKLTVDCIFLCDLSATVFFFTFLRTFAMSNARASNRHKRPSKPFEYEEREHVSNSQPLESKKYSKKTNNSVSKRASSKTRTRATTIEPSQSQHKSSCTRISYILT